MRNAVPTLKYMWLTTKHKAFVFRAGLRTRAPMWRLIIHDLSKYGPAEAPHYGRQFFGSKDDPSGFAAAWLHHQNTNPHHWEYWISRTTHNKAGGEQRAVILPMPEWAVREMVADWFGASRAYEGKWPGSLYGWSWFKKNWQDVALRLHPDSVRMVETVVRDALPDVTPHCLQCDGSDNLHYSVGGSFVFDAPCAVCDHIGRKRENWDEKYGWDTRSKTANDSPARVPQ